LIPYLPFLPSLTEEFLKNKPNYRVFNRLVLGKSYETYRVLDVNPETPDRALIGVFTAKVGEPAYKMLLNRPKKVYVVEVPEHKPNEPTPVSPKEYFNVRNSYYLSKEGREGRIDWANNHFYCYREDGTTKYTAVDGRSITAPFAVPHDITTKEEFAEWHNQLTMTQRKALVKYLMKNRGPKKLQSKGLR
jgi:hypothetical protein